MSDKCTDPEIGHLLARYEFGKLTPQEKKKFEKHLLECEACYKEYYSFLPVTETIKNNIEDFREAVRSREHFVMRVKDKIVAVVKNCIDNVNSMPRPARVIIPGFAAAVIVLMVYFFSSPGPLNDFSLIVNKSSEKSIVHPPESIKSKAYGDSISDSKLSSQAERDDFTESFMKKMFIKKNIERRALVFQWPYMPQADYYQCYLKRVKDEKIITSAKTLTDTLFMYPIESIPKNQTIQWNLDVYYKDGNKFLFTKEFKINF
ncbi:MAG: zf-HC2 domain-containing protein [bacterium]